MVMASNMVASSSRNNDCTAAPPDLQTTTPALKLRTITPEHIRSNFVVNGMETSVTTDPAATTIATPPRFADRLLAVDDLGRRRSVMR